MMQQMQQMQMMMMHSIYQEQKLTGNKAVVESTPGGENSSTRPTVDPDYAMFFPTTQMMMNGMQDVGNGPQMPIAINPDIMFLEPSKP